MRKSTRIVKRILALFLVVLMSIESFGAVVSDNDGSAFITKAEFDSLKNNFQSQIDQYNTSIDAKIDGAIAGYLAGITIQKVSERSLEIRNYGKIYSLDLESDENKWKFAYPYVDVRVYQSNTGTGTATGKASGDFKMIQTNYWRGYTESYFGRDAVPGRALAVNNIDKTKNTAEFAGISENHYWECYCRNIGSTGISCATKRNITGWTHSSTSSDPTNWRQVSSCSLDSVIADIRLTNKYTWPDGTASTSLGWAARKWSLSYIYWHDNNLIRKASIIWDGKSENKFEALDEDLGFGNEIPDYSDNVPTNTLFTRWEFKSVGDIFVKNTTDETDKTLTMINIDDSITGYSGDTTNYDDSISGAITYCDNKVWPGRHFCSDYITNWNQLYQPLWGTMYTDDGSYLKLIDGFPLVTVNENERLEYKIEFDENEEFEIIAKASPFGNTIDESNLLNISSDNHNWGKSCRVVKTGTLYFDFVDKNTLSKNATVIYIKWHKVNSTNNYNGGGTLNLSTNKTVKVTS